MKVIIARSLPLFALGALSIGFQVFIMRELLMAFNGQEIIIGPVLGCWILFTGIGARLAGTHHMNHKRPVADHAARLLALLPLLSIIVLPLLKEWLVPYGAIPGLTAIIALINASVIPYCLLAGFLFSHFAIRTGNSSSAYAIEALGSLFAGLLTTLVLFWLTGVALGIWIMAFLYIVLLTVSSFLESSVNSKRIGLNLVSATIISVAFFMLADQLNSLGFPGQRVISREETPYGKTIITEGNGQYNFYQNGIHLYSSCNIFTAEERAHYAMLQHREAKNVLLISGGYSGIIQELLKYRKCRITCLEYDPSLARMTLEMIDSAQQERVQVIRKDARTFMRSCEKRFDVILVNMPLPSNLQTNRYYTAEFVAILNRILVPDGVISWGLPVSSDNPGPGTINLLRILVHTINLEFPHVTVIPSNETFILASRQPVSFEMSQIADIKNIESSWIKYYFDEIGVQQRSRNLAGRLGNPVSPTHGNLPSQDINLDFNPVAVTSVSSLWLSMNGINPLLVIAACTLLTIILLFSANRVSSGLFTGGMTLVTTEIILILGLQVTLGNAYYLTGAVFAVAMAGLAAGSSVRINIGSGKSWYFWLQISMCLSVIAIFALPGLLNLFADAALPVVLLGGIILLIVSSIAGMEFRVAGSLSPGSLSKTVSLNYSADLFGAVTGVLVFGMVILPVAGFFSTCIILALSNLLSAFVFRIWSGR